MTDEDIFKGYTDFIRTIGEVDVGDYGAINERIYEGAQMKDLSMVDWIVRAINMQFVRDCVEKGEQDGTITFTGRHDSNNQPIYAATECIKRGLN